MFFTVLNRDETETFPGSVFAAFLREARFDTQMTYMYPKMRERAKEGEAVHGEGRHQLQNEGYGKGKGKR